MTHTVYMAEYRLVHFAALPSRLDVQANSRHPWNIEINGILLTFAWWGGETAANGSGMEEGRAMHPRKF